MKFVELNIGAKEVAINEVYSNKQEFINNKIELLRINKNIKGVFRSYQSNSVDLVWNFKNGVVNYKEFCPQLNIIDLLEDNEEVKEMWDELYEVTDGYSELVMKLSSEKAEVDFVLDYVPFLNTNYMLDFIAKYEDQSKASISDASDINSIFESVIKNNGLRVASYLKQKLNQIRIEINNIIEHEMNFLKSRKHIEIQLETKLNLNFDSYGYLISENQKTA
ncbi:hypothetical protein [Bacillus toyonensis]|uniref:hypothetical protein n=1 Tax=Bacillus toyonensis TaxID=155322 RepID=UPI002E1B4BD7|nr:hypothetical protein [Bacillus toyonensis]